MRRASLCAAAAGLLLAVPACSGDGGEREAGPAAQPPPPAASPHPRTTGADGGVFGRIPDVVDEVEPSVVAILTDSGEGSGVIWDDDGAVVTNNHVIAGASDVSVVLASGARLPAEVEAADERSDLAVLRVDRDGLPAANFRTGLPEVGELAIAMGNPLGFEQSVTAGIVSGVHRSIPSGGRTPALVDLIQTDAAISPGNSGGALLDANGDVIGINVAYIPPEQRAVAIGFAIPSPTVVSVVRQLLETGEVERAFLGVTVVPITPELAEQLGLSTASGVGVESVDPDSAAARAGIRGGDILVTLDGRGLRAVEDLYAELNRRRPGEVVTVGIVRDDERRTVEVRLDERP